MRGKVPERTYYAKTIKKATKEILEKMLECKEEKKGR